MAVSPHIPTQDGQIATCRAQNGSSFQRAKGSGPSPWPSGNLLGVQQSPGATFLQPEASKKLKARGLIAQPFLILFPQSYGATIFLRSPREIGVSDVPKHRERRRVQNQWRAEA